VNVLVTGGVGFIGSHLCERLLAEGKGVVCLDNFDDYYDPAIKRGRAERLERNPGFRLVEGDVRDESLLGALFGDVDAVVHLAARAGPRPSIEQPKLYYDVNVMGMLALLRAAAGRGVENFVAASSSSVYGLNTKLPFAEGDRIGAPASPYAASKAATETLGHTYAHVHGVPVTMVRLFTVYGPRQRPDMAFTKFAHRIVRGEPIELYGDGTSIRDYTYVDDVIDALSVILERPVPFEIFNVGGGHHVALTEVVDALQRELGREAIVRHVGEQAGDVPATWADVSHAREAFGYEPKVRFAEGIARFCGWFLRQGG